MRTLSCWVLRQSLTAWITGISRVFIDVNYFGRITLVELNAKPMVAPRQPEDGMFRADELVQENERLMTKLTNTSADLRRGLCGWSVIFVLTVLLGEFYVRSSTPAAIAMDFAEHDVSVQSAVGGVETAKLGLVGSIHYAGTEGWASFRMHVIGMRTNGILEVNLQRALGKWTVASARLTTDMGEVVKIGTEPSEDASAEDGG